MFKKLAQKLYSDRQKYSSAATNPLSVDFEKNQFLNKLTKRTVDLFEKNSDIKKFSKLVLSDPENQSHNDIVDELFSKNNIIDPFEDEKLMRLSDNEKFLRDLGLID